MNQKCQGCIDKLYPSFLGGKQGLALLLLRLVVGAAFVLHGAPKIQNAFTWMGDAPVPGVLQALAALSEFGGGIALILGLLTPLAALGIMGTMLGAMFLAHFPAGHPFVGKGGSYELALVYFVVALNVLFFGPGAYSADAKLFCKRSDQA